MRHAENNEKGVPTGIVEAVSQEPKILVLPETTSVQWEPFLRQLRRSLGRRRREEASQPLPEAG